MPGIFEAPPFSVTESIYWPFLLSPLIYGTRFLQRLSLKTSRLPGHIESDVGMPPDLINKLLFFIADGENKLLRRKPLGSSLFLVLVRDSCPSQHLNGEPRSQ